MRVWWWLGGVVALGWAACTLPRNGAAPDQPAGGGTGAQGGQGGTGGGVGSGGSGGGDECLLAADCDHLAADCREPRCQNGICVVDAAVSGTPCSAGVCNDRGECVGCTAASDCGDVVCVNGTLIEAYDCADGVCVDIAPVSCDGFACHESGHCLTSCGEHADCLDTHWCSGNDCMPKVSSGMSCTEPRGCLSGLCAAETCVGCGTPVPDPVTSCVTACTPLGGTCDGNVCVLDENAIACGGSCDGDTLTCPPGVPCRIDCTGPNNACRDAVINCPDDYDCHVDCGSDGNRCQRLELNCSAMGRCSISCGSGNTCNDSDVFCGENRCSATCNGTDSDKRPTLDCGDACACIPCM